MKFIKFHGIPWNPMELQKRSMELEFHGTFWGKIKSSMEFHGIIWNPGVWKSSMEFLLVSSKLAHSKFHGIPWNCWCQFHVIPWNLLFLFNGTIGIINTLSFKWDRIPWNLSSQILMKIIINCAGWINFRKLINTLYLFAVSFTNWGFIINICTIPYAFPALLITYQNIIQNIFSMLIKTYFDKKIPWKFLQNSMELFEQHLNNTCGSMEFHVILSRSKVPWNSMELFPYSRVPWNSMELLISPKKVPWNSMELFWNSMEFHRIPWNLIHFIFKKSYF